MASTATVTPVTLVTLGITSLSSSIYELGSLTFLNDTDAYLAIDINKYRVSWCQLFPFTVNSVTQTTTSFSFIQTRADQNFTITPFSATLNCGSYVNTWAYTGYNNSNGNIILNQASDLVGVDSLTGKILVSKSKSPGTYQVKIVGSLPDTTTYSAIFTIIINTNTPPKFITPLFNVTVPLISSYNYVFPTIIDPDSNDNRSITVKNLTGQLPKFITQATTTLTIFPKVITEVKIHQILVIINDSYNSIQYQFNITVTQGLPPVFQTNAAIENKFLQINTIAQQTLPAFSDPEGGNLTLSFKPELLSQFISIKGNSIIYAPSQIFQVGKHEITFIVTDNQELSVNKTYHLVVFLPPKFVGSLPKQINLQASTLSFYNLPLQGNSDEYVTHSGLPSYATFEYPNYQFLPSKVSDLGMQVVSGQLFNTYTSIQFSFKVNVTNEAPYFSSKLVNQVMAINTKLSYFTPEVFDREGQSIRFTTHEVGQPSLPFFAKFLPPTREFQFSPTQQDQQKAYQIQLNIIDSFGASSSATFTITLYDASSQSMPEAAQDQTSKSSTSGAAQGATGSGGSNISISTINKKKKSNDIETIILAIDIVKVTRDHRATLKIYNPEALPGQKTATIIDVMLQISNQSFGAVVLQHSGTSYKIPMQIIEKDLKNSLLQVNLKYPNPSNISTSQTPDKLKVSTLNRIQITKSKVWTELREYSNSTANIPSQITQSYEQALMGISQGGRIAFTQDTSSNLIIGFVIQMIWIQFEDISFLVINSLLQISIPGLPQTILGFLMKYIFFDILYTELWVENFMSGTGIDFENVKNDTAINIQFSDNGFGSKQFLKNSGSSFFFLVIYVFSWLILLMLFLLPHRFKKINNLKEQLKKQLIWKQSLNFLMNQFSILLQCSLINFYDIRINDDKVIAKLSSIISILVFIALMIALLMIYWKVCRLTKTLNHNQVTEFNQRFSTLTESFKQTKFQKIIYFWKPLYLLRWTLTIMVLTMIQDHPSFQILCLLGLSVVWQYLILTARPYESRAQNIITFVNEIAVSCYLYLAFMLSDYLDTQVIDNQPLLSYLKLQIAWVLTSLLLGTILINFIYALVNIGAATVRYVKSKIKCKRKRDFKREEQSQTLNDVTRQNPKNYHTPHVDVTKFADFSQLGYESYEHYPGAYAFPKEKEEVKDEQLFEKNHQQFNFYEHM